MTFRGTRVDNGRANATGVFNATSRSPGKPGRATIEVDRAVPGPPWQQDVRGHALTMRPAACAPRRRGRPDRGGGRRPARRSGVGGGLLDRPRGDRRGGLPRARRRRAAGLRRRRRRRSAPRAVHRQRLPARLRAAPARLRLPGQRQARPRTRASTPRRPTPTGACGGRTASPATWIYSSESAGSLNVPDGGYVAFSWNGSADKVASRHRPSPHRARAHGRPDPEPPRRRQRRRRQRRGGGNGGGSGRVAPATVVAERLPVRLGVGRAGDAGQVGQAGEQGDQTDKADKPGTEGRRQGRRGRRRHRTTATERRAPVDRGRDDRGPAADADDDGLPGWVAPVGIGCCSAPPAWSRWSAGEPRPDAGRDGCRATCTRWPGGCGRSGSRRRRRSPPTRSCSCS